MATFKQLAVIADPRVSPGPMRGVTRKKKTVMFMKRMVMMMMLMKIMILARGWRFPCGGEQAQRNTVHKLIVIHFTDSELG